MKLARIFSFSNISYQQDIGFEKQYYKLEVICTGSIHSDGMIINTKYLDLYVKPVIKELSKCSVLSDLIPNPTMENIVTWIYYRLTDKIPGVNLKLWIDDNTYVEWK